MTTDKLTLELTGVSFSYERSLQEPPILSNVSFNVSPAEFVCIMGPSGAGKTTLLRLIAGSLAATGGSIRYNQKRPRIGYVFQDERLFYWLTVFMNIDIVCRKYSSKPGATHELLRRAGLISKADAYPGELSGGQRQRLALTQIMATKPDIILLDEPFSNLDRSSRHEMEDFLLSVWAELKCPIILVTHDPEEAVRLADRVLIMSASPASVAESYAISFNRPRSLDRKRYLDAVTEIDGLLIRQNRTSTRCKIDENA